MAENIREWGRRNGFEVPEEGRLPSGLRAAYDSRDKNTVEDVPEAVIEERAPVIPKPSGVDRLRGLADKAKKVSKPPVARGRKTSTKARVSVEKVISGAWGMAAGFAATRNPALGRVMAMQAPVAGMILEDKVRGTVVDTFLQPLARGADGGNTAIALLGPPLLIQALSMQPHRAPQIIPMLRYSLRSWIQVAGDKLDKLEEEDQEFEKKYGSRIDQMLEFLIEPLMGQAE